MSKKPPKFRVGKRVMVSKLPAIIIERTGGGWMVCVAGFKFPCYPDEIRPMTAREIRERRR